MAAPMMTLKMDGAAAPLWLAGNLNINEESSGAPWEEYERRKAAIQRMGLSDREYEQAIRRLADELGV